MKLFRDDYRLQAAVVTTVTLPVTAVVVAVLLAIAATDPPPMLGYAYVGAGLVVCLAAMAGAILFSEYMIQGRD